MKIVLLRWFRPWKHITYYLYENLHDTCHVTQLQLKWTTPIVTNAETNTPYITPQQAVVTITITTSLSTFQRELLIYKSRDSIHNTSKIVSEHVHTECLYTVSKLVRHNMLETVSILLRNF